MFWVCGLVIWNDKWWILKLRLFKHAFCFELVVFCFENQWNFYLFFFFIVSLVLNTFIIDIMVCGNKESMFLKLKMVILGLLKFMGFSSFC
jgi:hypothetical protein